jgi:cytochrome P450
MSEHYPPGPPNRPFGSNHLRAIRNGLVGFGAGLQREFGDVVHFRLGSMDCYQLTHPDQVHDVLVHKARKFRKPKRLKQVFGRFEGNGLVLSEGEFWARQRRLVQPAFQPSLLASHAEIVVAAATATIERWGARAEFDFAAAMTRLALIIVTRSLFSATVEDDVDCLAIAVDSIQRWSMLELNRIVATPRWFPLLGHREPRYAIRFLDQLIRRIVRQRRASREPRNDLLGRLLAAVDTEGDGQGMTERQLRDELVTLLLAGHETTGAALTWAGWLLACYPEIQERLAASVGEVLGPRPATFHDLPVLRFVEMAFKEAMRLHPPVYFFSREVADPVEVAGYLMRPGSQVFLFPYITQRDPRWFPNPQVFDPWRFEPDRESQRPALAWFPFGAGPRACIGRGFALMEGTLILASLLQTYRLTISAEQEEPMPEWQLSLHPRGGIRLVAERRA